MGIDLAKEYMLDANIVADGGNHRGVDAQVHRRQRRSAGGHRVLKFDCEMCCVTAGTTVAHGVDASLVAIYLRHCASGIDQRLRIFGEKPPLDIQRVLRLLAHRFQQRVLFSVCVFCLTMQERVERL